MPIRIFISHASADAPLVAAIASAVENVVGLSKSEIRCTSVPGYTLPAVTNFHDVLRDEVITCDIVLGVMSSASLASSFVLLELGARWGIARPMMLCHKNGFVFPSAAPLATSNSKPLDNMIEVEALMTDIAAMLGLTRKCAPGSSQSGGYLGQITSKA